MKNILIVGATAAIAQKTAAYFARDGASLIITGRDQTRLDVLAADLRVRGAIQVNTIVCDMNDFDRHESVLDDAIKASNGKLDAVLIAHGTLGEQKAGEQSFAVAHHELKTNFLSVVSFLTLLANYFATQKHGLIAVIGSVAGDRGRQSNYIYGTAKAAVSFFLQGLRNRLFPLGVGVLTIKPGFIDTPMTAHVPKNFLFASADQAGFAIHNAMIKGKDVVYVPGFWRVIMLVIKFIPECVFKRLKM